MNLILMMGLALLFNRLEIRCCPIFYLFHIPCPGCGLTRSMLYLLNDPILSFQYNPLGPTLTILLGINILFILMNKQKQLHSFLTKHKKIIFLICLLLFLLIEIHNLHNPLLYSAIIDAKFPFC